MTLPDSAVRTYSKSLHQGVRVRADAKGLCVQCDNSSMFFKTFRHDGIYVGIARYCMGRIRQFFLVTAHLINVFARYVERMLSADPQQKVPA